MTVAQDSCADRGVAQLLGENSSSATDSACMREDIPPA